MYQNQLQTYLNAHGLDAEVCMLKCGNLEMACKATLAALQNGRTDYPECMTITKKLQQTNTITT